MAREEGCLIAFGTAMALGIASVWYASYNILMWNNFFNPAIQTPIPAATRPPLATSIPSPTNRPGFDCQFIAQGESAWIAQQKILKRGQVGQGSDFYFFNSAPGIDEFEGEKITKLPEKVKPGNAICGTIRPGK